MYLYNSFSIQLVVNYMTDDRYLVSILCCTYNHENYIKDTLYSLINQKTSFKFKVIVVDDFSQDNTVDIVKRFQKKFPESIVLIENDFNHYSSVGHPVPEKALEYLGPFIALCDGDDLWIDDTKLEKQMAVHFAHKCSLCVCLHTAGTSILSQNKVSSRSTRKNGSVDVTDYFHPSTFVFSTAVFKEQYYRAKKFRLFGDLYMWIFAHSVVNRFGPIVALPMYSAFYRLHQNGVWSPKSSFQKKISRLRIFVILLLYGTLSEKKIVFQLILFKFLRRFQLVT